MFTSCAEGSDVKLVKKKTSETKCQQTSVYAKKIKIQGPNKNVVLNKIKK